MAEKKSINSIFTGLCIPQIRLKIFNTFIHLKNTLNLSFNYKLHKVSVDIVIKMVNELSFTQNQL